MVHPDYPFALPQECGEDAVECLDGARRSLMVMPWRDAVRSGLNRRGVAITVHTDGGRRILLRRNAASDPLFPRLWDLPAHGPVFAGESAEDAALRLLGFLGGSRTPLVVLGRLEPDECAVLFQKNAQDRLFLEVLRAGPVSTPLPTDDLLLLDAEELEGFTAAFSDFLAPPVREFMRRGWLGPRSFAPETD